MPLPAPFLRPVLALAALLAFAPAAGRAAPADPTPTYLALGDSLAYGMQVGRLREQMAAGHVEAASFDTGYADVLLARLRSARPGLRLVDMGCPGEGTASFIAGPCAYATNGKPFATTPLPLHTPYAGAQLAAATDYLGAHPGEVTLITLDIGINDLRAVQLACGEGPDAGACVASRWPAALERTSANLRQILAALRRAAPAARLVVLTYYNWLAATVPGSDAPVEALDGAITKAAAGEGAEVVDLFGPFNGIGDVRARLCALTLVCGPLHDLHPSDEGYRLIATLIADRLGR